MPSRASSSARSLSSSPLWPFTQCQEMSWRLVASSKACQSSTFFTGFLSAVFQPLRFQPWIQPWTPFLTYWLSVWISTLQGRVRALSASMAAVSSILLLVVSGAPPFNSLRCCPNCRMAPQPPGPGLPEQAPSVWMMTVSAMDRPPVDMELAGKAARLGFDMGLFHADPFEDREGGGVAGVGEADEVLAFAAPEEPVAQPRRRFRRIARPVKILEQGVAYFRFAGGGINPEAGAADEPAVALAGQAQFAQLPGFEQVDPGLERCFG